MKISSSWHIHASNSKEMFLVMALTRDGDAPDKFAIEDIFFVIEHESTVGDAFFYVMARGNPATAEARRTARGGATTSGTRKC
ncbi:MAG: hypothetical protein QM795_11880 [Pseudoxanthomonas sp.]